MATPPCARCLRGLLVALLAGLLLGAAPPPRRTRAPSRAIAAVQTQKASRARGGVASPGKVRLAQGAPLDDEEPGSVLAGGIPGRFEPGPRGAATYTLPVEVPPGVQGAQPRLALRYGSDRGNGPLGVGWTLDGLSAITRCAARSDLDGAPGGVRHDAGDRFCLDGERLINVAGENGVAGSTYRTERESWRRVVASADRCGAGPCGFTVTTATGVRQRYGLTEGARITAVGRAEVRLWALEEEEDLHGNKVLYRYTASPLVALPAVPQLMDGELYLSRIDYAANATVSPPLAPRRSVRLVWSARPDPISRYQGDAPVVTRALLRHLVTYLDEQPVRDYRLTYDTAVDTGRSRLRRVRVCAGTATSAPCLEPTELHATDAASTALTPVDAGLTLSPSYLQVLGGDVNGDGRGDVVVLTAERPMRAQVALAGAGGKLTACDGPISVPFQQGQRLLLADVNGDGRADLVQLWSMNGVLRLARYLSSATRCGFQTGQETGTSLGAPLMELFALDVNGDGRVDLAIGTRAVGSNTLDVVCAISGPAGFTLSAASHLPYPSGARLWPMDVNGDGQADLVRASIVGGRLSLAAHLSTGLTFTTGIDSSFVTFERGAPAMWPADVNGDGLIDLVQLGREGGSALQLTPYLAAGAGHFVRGDPTATTRPVRDLATVWAADVNGDGRTDLLQAVTGLDGARRLVLYRAVGAGPGGTGFDPGVDTGVSLPPPRTEVILPLDLDGAGRVALVQAWSDGKTLQARSVGAPGQPPDRLAALEDGDGGQLLLAYGPLTDPSVYTPSTAAVAYPYVDALAAAPSVVLQQYTLQSAQAAVAPYRYRWALSYGQGLVDNVHGDLGFRTVARTDLQTGRRTVTTYQQTYPLTGTPVRIDEQCDARSAQDPLCPAGKVGTALRSTVIDPEAVVTATGATAPAPKVYTVRPVKVREDEYRYGAYLGSRGRQLQYDAYDNLTRVAELGAVDSTGKDQREDDNVYRCTRTQVDPQRWQLRALLDTKVSTASACDAFDRFAPGVDYTLERRSYDAQLGLESRAAWDDGNSVFLTTRYQHDGYGNVTAEIAPGGATTITRYDPRDHTFPDVREFPAGASGRSMMERYGHDPRTGQRVGLFSANQLAHVRCLDPFGRVSQVQGPPQLGMPAQTNCVTPEVSGSVAATLRGSPVVTLERREWRRGASGGLFFEQSTLQSWSGGAPELRWTRSYRDGLGREQKRLDQFESKLQAMVTCTARDSEGREVQRSLPEPFDGEGPGCVPGDRAGPARWTLTRHDVLGRPVERSAPAGADGDARTVTTLQHLGMGMVIVTNAAADDYRLQRILTYREFGGEERLLQVRMPSDRDAAIALGYDRIGRLIRITDPRTTDNPAGVTTTLGWDSLGRPLTVNDGDRNTTAAGVALRYAYRPDTGFLRSMTDVAGRRTEFEEDALGRVTRVRLPEGTSYEYQYDDPTASNGQGALTRVTGKAGGAALFQYDHRYDAYGRRIVTLATVAGEPEPFRTERLFDPLGRERTLTYPDQIWVSHSYTMGNLTGVRSGQTTYAAYETFTPLGAPQRVTAANGATEERGYSPQGDLTKLRVGDRERRGLLDLGLEWDHLGGLTRVTDAAQVGGVSASELFGYAGGRLVQATAPGLYGAEEYRFDPSGNLTTLGARALQYQAHRLVAGSEGGAAMLALAYDPNGNRLRKQIDGVSWSYAYDGWNRLTEVKRNGQTVLGGIVYDHQGRMLRRTDANGITTIAPDPDYALVRQPDGTTLGTRTVQGLDGPVAMVTTLLRGSTTTSPGPGYPPVGTLYLHRDHLGSTVATTDVDGYLRTRRMFYPWGAPLATKAYGPEEVPTGFQGQPWDPGSQLLLSGARAYDPLLGRYLSPEPTPVPLLDGEGGPTDALNLFAFGENRPATVIEPARAWQRWTGPGGAGPWIERREPGAPDDAPGGVGAPWRVRVEGW